MGLFDSFMGPKHEELPADHAFAAQLSSDTGLAELAASTRDRIEVVPGPGMLFAYVGKPPKAFGVVWFDDGQRLDVRSALEAGLMKRDAVGPLTQALARIHTESESAPRYSFKTGGRSVVVTDAPRMYQAIEAAMAEATD